MLRRHLFPVLLLTILLFPVERAGADWAEPDQNESLFDDDGLICAGRLAWQNSFATPPYGPSSIAARVARICQPELLPKLDVTPVKPPEGSVVPFVYAQVIQNHAPVYNHPLEAVYGLSPKRRLGAGFIWVSVQGETSYEGRDYYQINAGEYIPAEALSTYRPSTFQGIALAEQPQGPLAWVLRAVRPSLTPGGEANAEAPVYQRYQVVQIFAAQRLDDQVWYLIGPDQWVNQVYVAKVTPSAPPPGVGAGAAWIDVDLFEQTLAAYVGERMVYATLISSGLPGWDTPTGLYQVWQKVETGKMSGAYNLPDYYFLEDVPWAMYFNRDVALHGAYWHSSFGYRHSHGCVNLAPADARWLFNWMPEAAWVRVQSGQGLATD